LNSSLKPYVGIFPYGESSYRNYTAFYLASTLQ